MANETNSMEPLEIPCLTISYQGVMVGKIYFYSRYLRQEDTHLVQIQSGPCLLLEVCISSWKQKAFVLCLFVLALLLSPFLHWCQSLFLPDSRIYCRPPQESSLVDKATTRFLNFLFIGSHCWISSTMYVCIHKGEYLFYSSVTLQITE